MGCAAGNSGSNFNPNETMRLVLSAFLGIMIGFLMGTSLPISSWSKFDLCSNLSPPINYTYLEQSNSSLGTQALLNSSSTVANVTSNSTLDNGLKDNLKIFVPTNPRGAEMLPPKIVVSESDFFLRRLWGNPATDLPVKPKYLVAFTVGYDQRKNINAAIKKFSENFTIILFHYDGRTSEWEEFEWSRRAIHVSARKQTKWWFAKRFLHPDIIAPYEYVFIWDEDLELDHFNGEEYIRLVKKHGLEISQPGLDPVKMLTWKLTERIPGREIHKEVDDKSQHCKDRHSPPCAAFVEIMAPVFSRDAWRCLWHMIQNDLVHGWGLDFALRRCVEPAHEKIGVVDAQFIAHKGVPSLRNQGEPYKGRGAWDGVNDRCFGEWAMFSNRLEDADNAYYSEKGIPH